MSNQPKNQMKPLKKQLLTVLFFAVSLTTFSQVGIGTTDPKASLDVVSTDSGFLMPRVVDHTALTVSADQIGMQVYDMTTSSVWVYNGVTWGAFSTGTAKFVDGTDPSDTAIMGGDLGIGTIDPTEKLEVNGNILITGDLLATPASEIGSSTQSFSNIFVDQITDEQGDSGTTGQHLSIDATGNIDWTTPLNTIPLWQSDTDGGSYTANDIINYNGILYKSLTAINTDIDPISDTTNWTKHAATLVSDTDGDTSVETERSTDDDKVYIKTKGIDRLTISNTGTISRGNIKINNGQFSSLNYLDIGFNGSNGIAKFTAIGNGNTSAEFYTSNSGTSTLALRIEENQNITISKDLTTDTFSTVWVNATNGGVYDPNDIAVYEGSLYKNITGTNSNTTPDSDAANWKNITGVSSLEAKSMIDAQNYDVTSNTFDGEWELFYSIAESQVYIRNIASDITINGDVGYFVSNNGTVAVSPRAISLTQYVWSTLWTDVSLGYTSDGSREWVQFTDALDREYLFKTTLGAAKVLMEFQRIK